MEGAVTDVIVVFTAKSVDRIIREGGTSSWTLDRNNARQREFAVCARNAHADWVEGSEHHGSAFLIGRISDVVPSQESEGRWLIKFSEFARLDVPNAWKGWRNPVHYSSFQELGIDPTTLTFEPMPAEETTASASMQPAEFRAVQGLSIGEAKAGLAVTFGVNPEQIEIVIRG
jgi:hypothetical protein